MTPEVFSQRIREIVHAHYPKASISIMLGFHGGGYRRIEEYDGKLWMVDGSGNIPLLQSGDPRW